MTDKEKLSAIKTELGRLIEIYVGISEDRLRYGTGFRRDAGLKKCCLIDFLGFVKSLPDEPKPQERQFCVRCRHCQVEAAPIGGSFEVLRCRRVGCTNYGTGETQYEYCKDAREILNGTPNPETCVSFEKKISLWTRLKRAFKRPCVNAQERISRNI